MQQTALSCAKCTTEVRPGSEIDTRGNRAPTLCDRPPATSAAVNVNGRITSERDAVISVFDHGFLSGEGMYETLRTNNGRAAKRISSS